MLSGYLCIKSDLPLEKVSLIYWLKRFVVYVFWKMGYRVSRIPKIVNEKEHLSIFVPTGLDSLSKIDVFEAQHWYWGFKTTIIWKELFDRANKSLEEHNYFIDLGAHAGLFSNLATNCGLSGVAVEASPLNVQLLQRNLKNKSVEVFSGAIVPDTYEGKSIRFFSGTRSTNGSTARSFEQPLAESSNVEALKFKSVVKRIPNFDTIKLLVKIDIEGMEWEMLDEIVDLSRRLKNLTLLIEIHKKDGKMFVDFTNQLEFVGLKSTCITRGETMDVIATNF